MKYKILLAPFPFGDLRTRKYRPVLCLTGPQGRHRELVLAYITSNVAGNKMASDLLVSSKDEGFKLTGLKVDSVIKLNKLVTLPKDMIAGQLGCLSSTQKKSAEQKLKKLFGL